VPTTTPGAGSWQLHLNFNTLFVWLDESEIFFVKNQYFLRSLAEEKKAPWFSVAANE
jgi:hypothetical protein